MSRGPGVWQRGILAALDQYPAVRLMDLLPRPRTRAQVVALNRAARQLAAAGTINLRHFSRMAASGSTVIARPDYHVRDPWADVIQLRRVSVALPAACDQCNT
jgi:hypothetical protein